MMVENVLDAYAQLFVHQLITAQLYDNDATIWENKLTKLEEIRHELLQEE